MYTCTSVLLYSFHHFPHCNEFDWLIEWLSDSSIDWLSVCVYVCVSFSCVCDCTVIRIEEWVIGWSNEWMNECAIEYWMEWLYFCLSYWKKEWLIDWCMDILNEFISQSSLFSLTLAYPLNLIEYRASHILSLSLSLWCFCVGVGVDGVSL